MSPASGISASAAAAAVASLLLSMDRSRRIEDGSDFSFCFSCCCVSWLCAGSCQAEACTPTQQLHRLLKGIHRKMQGIGEQAHIHWGCRTGIFMVCMLVPGNIQGRCLATNCRQHTWFSISLCDCLAGDLGFAGAGFFAAAAAALVPAPAEERLLEAAAAAPLDFLAVPAGARPGAGDGPGAAGGIKPYEPAAEGPGASASAGEVSAAAPAAAPAAAASASFCFLFSTARRLVAAAL